MEDAFRKLQAGLTHTLRNLTAPSGKQYVPLDPEIEVDGNEILVDQGLGQEGLDAARRQFVLEQWTSRDQWTKGPPQPPAISQATLSIVLLGVLALALALSVGAVLLWGSRAWLVGGFVILISVFGIALSALTLVRHRKFSPGALQLETAPVALGDCLRGTVKTGVTHRLKPDGMFTLELRCVRTRSSSTDSGGQHDTSTTVWSSAAQAKGFLTQGSQHYSIEFDLQVPSDQMPWTLGSGTEKFHWELVVRADMPGLDYVERFRLPVLSVRDYQIVCAAQ